jgi:hypothetical protein
MKKKCFIITPIGDEGSITRDKAEGVIESITPVLEELGFGFDIPHRMAKPGSITKQILECILNHDLVIANLTELNPNVMYELAVRHSTAKPVITIAEFGTKLPFDITTERTIFYSNDMRGVPKLQKELRTSITSVDFEQPEYDNPIYRAQRDFKFKEVTTESKEVYIIQQLDEIKNMQQYINSFFISRSNYNVNNGGIRLIKVSKKFNLGINALVEFLIKNGYNVEASPNAKISQEAYELIVENFGTKNDDNVEF